MIIHVAIFKWKNSSKKEEICAVLRDIQQLKQKIPGLEKIYTGKNYHKRSKGFTHGVIVVAKDKKSLNLYRKHPDHEKIAKKIEILTRDGIGFDFENNHL
jgi:hypothetical protein